jgi:hypothetical protein
MAETSYSYTVSTDFPGGNINVDNLKAEIQTSSIVTALERIDLSGDSVSIVFKDTLSTGDKTTLDGDTTGPAGGLIASHDSTPIDDPQAVSIKDHHIFTAPAKRNDAKIFYVFSPDLTDKCSWYLDAVKVTDEAVGTGDGTTVTFNLACGGDGTAKLLQVYGKVTNALALKPTPHQLGGTDWGTAGEYIPVVTVDDVAQTMDRPFRSSGDKDYVWDVDAQTITFHTAPANGLAIVATYWYVPTAATCHLMRLVHPPTGKKWTIDYVEAQFSQDMEYNDTIIFGAYPKGVYTVPLEPELHYTNAHEVDDYSIRSVPSINAWGGTTSARKATQAKDLKFWEYVEELSVSSVQNPALGGLGGNYVELNARLEEGTVFGGERATVTIRILEEDI